MLYSYSFVCCKHTNELKIKLAENIKVNGETIAENGDVVTKELLEKVKNNPEELEEILKKYNYI